MGFCVCVPGRSQPTLQKGGGDDSGSVVKYTWAAWCPAAVWWVASYSTDTPLSLSLSYTASWTCMAPSPPLQSTERCTHPSRSNESFQCLKWLLEVVLKTFIGHQIVNMKINFSRCKVSTVPLMTDVMSYLKVLEIHVWPYQSTLHRIALQGTGTHAHSLLSSHTHSHTEHASAHSRVLTRVYIHIQEISC